MHTYIYLYLHSICIICILNRVVYFLGLLGWSCWWTSDNTYPSFQTLISVWVFIYKSFVGLHRNSLWIPSDNTTTQTTPHTTHHNNSYDLVCCEGNLVFCEISKKATKWFYQRNKLMNKRIFPPVALRRMDSKSLLEGRSWYLLFKTWDESEDVLLASLSRLSSRAPQRRVPQVGL